MMCIAATSRENHGIAYYTFRCYGCEACVDITSDFNESELRAEKLEIVLREFEITPGELKENAD
jgi:Fe-S-cluster-containing dehydrogenase component